MKGENYKTMSAYFSETKARNQTIKALHDVLPLVMYIFYPVQMIALAINNGIGSEVFLRFTLIPLCTLILVTVIRALINAKRPYEVYDYTPAVHKDTKGKSFPSRHTVCAFIIAMGVVIALGSLSVVSALRAGTASARRKKESGQAA